MICSAKENLDTNLYTDPNKCRGKVYVIEGRIKVSFLHFEFFLIGYKCLTTTPKMHFIKFKFSKIINRVTFKKSNLEEFLIRNANISNSINKMHTLRKLPSSFHFTTCHPLSHSHVLSLSFINDHH